VELDHRRFEQAKKTGIPAVYGDASHEVVLDAAGIGTAALLVVTVPDMVTTRAIIQNARRRNPELQIIARSSSPDNMQVMKDMGVSETVLPELEASLEMSRQSLLRLKMSPMEVQRHTDKVRQELYSVLSDTNDGYRELVQLRGAEHQFDLQWVKLAAASGLAGKSIGESNVRKTTGASIVGVVRNGDLKTNPDASFVLEAGDLIAVIGGDADRLRFCSLSKQGNEEAVQCG
jgi:CPA2 family monovalent cation:H+ antiporter-2